MPVESTFLTKHFQDVKMAESNTYSLFDTARSSMRIEIYIFLAILTIWLVGASILIAKIYILFNKLTKGVGVDDLKKVLEKVIQKEEENLLNIKELSRRLSWLEEDGKIHVQKVGIVRFNPFKELGGEHSFSLAILNGEDSGIVITSLHTRDRTRVYMKDIKKNKSSFELSAEEKKAISNAQKSK